MTQREMESSLPEASDSEKAIYAVRWSSADHGARVIRAHDAARE
jgi:hypothetical protein